jgi:hypothetical protein
LNRKKFLILLVVLVGFSGIVKIGKCGTLSDSGMDLTDLDKSSVAWGDIDNDGDFDLAIMGWDETNRHFQIYKNGANNKLTLSQSLTGVSNGGLSFGDYDRDGDLDLAITGKVTEYGTTKIYQNDGKGTFSDSGIEMVDVYNSALAWGDYDNDGDLDLVIIGFRMGTGNTAKIYENKGDGTFKDSGITDLMAVASGSVAWGDYDNDGDLDLAITGDAGVVTPNCICMVYENDYKNNPSSPFSPGVSNITDVRNSSLAWGDYDNDGWLDIAICGETTDLEYVCEIWKNDGDGTFSKTQSLTGVYNSSLAWGDYDNDGDLDLVVIGLASGETRSSKIYEYGSDNFSEDTEQSLDDVEQGSVAWCDYDGDKDIDLAVTGSSGSAVTKIYKSAGFGKNTLPNPPESSKFKTTYNSTTKELTISWPAGDDTETNLPAGLYYNLRIGSESGKDDLVAARYGSPLLGNFISKSTSTVDGKQARTFSLYAKGYYWSVQAIDTGLGCSWSQEGTESGWSEEDHYDDKSPPPEPETPTDEGEYTYNTTIRFRWTQNNPDPETAIYNYRLQVRSEDGTVFNGSVGNVKSYWVSGCEYNKTYEARVMAQSGGGWSDWSNWSNGIMVVRLLDITNNLIHPKKADKTATIKYFIINPAKVNLKIYNLIGELVMTLVDNQSKVAGSYNEPWSGENDKGSTVASGIYLVHIEAGGENATEKICVVK